MKEEIKKIFKGEVADDEATILMYSHDASLLEVRPKVVVYPKDAQDVKNLVKWVDENKNKYKDPEYRKKLLRVKKNDGKTTIKINRCYNSNIFTI